MINNITLKHDLLMFEIIPRIYVSIHDILINNYILVYPMLSVHQSCRLKPGKWHW